MILPSYTCQSLLHPIHHVGAEPVPVDVDPETLSVSARTVRPHITENTELIVLVHNFGYPVEDAKLFNLDVSVLEDLATAIGSHRSDGTHVGRQGVACIGSFYATKQVSAGLGGFVASDNPDLIDAVKDLKTYDERDEFRPAYNYSFSDLNAGLARSQLSKIPERLEHHRKIADLYDEGLEELPELSTPERPQGHALYRYVIKHSEAGRLSTWMQEEQKIEVKRPVHEPLHRFVGTQNQTVTDTLHDEAVMLPLHPSLDHETAELVIDLIKTWNTNLMEPWGS